MIEMTQTDDGVLLAVHAQPGSRKNGLAGIHDGRLKVAVTTAPEKGKANKHLTKVIAAELGLKRSQVSLHSGDHTPRKVFLIADITANNLRQRIDAVL